MAQRAKCMSSSNNTLTVEAADVAAEISVFDGSLNQVARSVGRLQKDLAPGICKVRVRAGPSFREQLVSLDQNRQVQVDSIPFASPIPLAGTSRSREYHQAAAVEASAKPRASFGSGASILVFAREWSAGKEKSQRNPAEELI